jgi:putative flippase GtrA
MIKFLKFCAVGVTNTIITLIVFYLINKVLMVNYIVSTSVSYLCGVVNSYYLNRRYTFKDKNSNVFLQFTRFITLNLVSLGVNLILMYLFVELFYLDSMIAQVLSTIATTLLNFAGSKLIVFGKVGG